MLPFECVKMKENRKVRTPSPAAFAGLIDESFIRAMNWIVTAFAWHGQKMFVQVPASRRAHAMSTMNRNWILIPSMVLKIYNDRKLVKLCSPVYVADRQGSTRMLIIDNKWP